MFGNSIRGGTTTKDTYYYVLSMVPGAIDTLPICPAIIPAPVIAYASGAAAGNAVYDCGTGYTGLANANLAAEQSFGISGTTIIDFGGHRTVTVPLIDNGSMLFVTAMQWVDALDASHYLGSLSWHIPASAATAPMRAFAHDTRSYCPQPARVQ